VQLSQCTHIDGEKTSCFVLQGRLTQAEGRAVGDVKRRVYLEYLRAWGPCWLVPAAMLSSSVLGRGLQVLTDRCLVMDSSVASLPSRCL
jgi:hypothetical protein